MMGVGVPLVKEGAKACSQLFSPSPSLIPPTHQTPLGIKFRLPNQGPSIKIHQL